MSGYVGDLSDDQQSSLDDFKAQLNAADDGTYKDMHYTNQPDDHVCLRFLRYNKFDVSKAVAQYQKMQKWRLDEKMDELYENPPAQKLDLYKKIIPHAHHGFDKEGRPIYYMLAGKAHMSIMLKYIGEADVVKVHCWDMECFMKKCRDQTKALGKQVDTMINILDLEGMGMQHRHILPFLNAITQSDEDYYPETLGRTIVVNAPWVFPALWKLVKMFLDPVVASRVEVLGADFKEVLARDFIDPEQLPVEFGGTCEGVIFVSDEKEVEAELAALEADKGQVQEHIPAGKTFTKSIPIEPTTTEGGKTVPVEVSWWFRTKAYNVSFAVTFKSATGKTTEIVKAATVESQNTAVNGSCTLDELGTVDVIWDNYSSWTTPKDLSYVLSQRNVVEAVVDDDEQKE